MINYKYIYSVLFSLAFIGNILMSNKDKSRLNDNSLKEFTTQATADCVECDNSNNEECERVIVPGGVYIFHGEKSDCPEG